MKFVVLGLLSFLAVVGFVEMLRKFIFWIYKPEKTKFYMGAVIRDPDEAENTVRSMVERLKWMELGAPVDIIIIDKTKNPKVPLIIQKIIKDFPNVSLL